MEQRRCFPSLNNDRPLHWPGHDAKREGDLLGRGQAGVPAHEQQPQDVVSIVTLGEAFRSQVSADIRERTRVL
jgi:hypothetical protein